MLAGSGVTGMKRLIAESVSLLRAKGGAAEEAGLSFGASASGRVRCLKRRLGISTTSLSPPISSDARTGYP
jgi:hypothetical protein